MLKINFLNNEATLAQAQELAQATRFELCDMTKKMNLDAIAKQAKIVANEKGNYDEDEVATAQAKIDKLEAENEKLDATMEELRTVYDSVIEAMTVPNDKGYSNNADTVRTVLRVVACAENSKLYKYAIIPAFENEDLYNALEAIHVNNEVTEEGYSTNSKERVALYKSAQEQLDNIMRDTFSLPIATPYTTALRVKLNAQDRKVLHDVYVKGFSNKFEKDDDGTITFKSRKYNTAVKKNRKGDIDYSGLATDIAKLVIAKYAEVK